MRHQLDVVLLATTIADRICLAGIDLVNIISVLLLLGELTSIGDRPCDVDKDVKVFEAVVFDGLPAS